MSAPEGQGLPEAEFASLLSGLSSMAPFLRAALGGVPAAPAGAGGAGFASPPSAADAAPAASAAGPAPERSPLSAGAPPPHPAPLANARSREALLLALRPYLSPRRAAAVETLIRLARVSDALRLLP